MQSNSDKRVAPDGAPSHLQDLTPEGLIVHLDDDLAVVQKPAGLVVHAAPSVKGKTLVDLLGEVLGGGEEARPGIVHRLDKDTSGLMLVARNDQAHRALARMVKAREVEREYTALVHGRLGSRTGTIDAPLGRHRRERTKRAVKGNMCTARYRKSGSRRSTRSIESPMRWGFRRAILDTRG